MLKGTKIPMVYVNQVGAQTELIFDGGSIVMSEKGELVEQLPFFKEEISIVEIPGSKFQGTKFPIGTANSADSRCLDSWYQGLFPKAGF